MSRRQRYNREASGGVTGERASIGDNHVAKAMDRINKWAAATAAMLVEFNHPRDEILPWIFPDETLDKLRAVKGLIDPSTDTGTYEMPHKNVYLNIEFNDCIVPTPMREALRINHDRAEPLLAMVDQMKGIHEQFETVKHVLRWLNRNATPGAVRYYFPAAMRLCPDSPSLIELQHTPVRYSTPPGITEQLSAIRQAANTVASAALMSTDARGNPNSAKMWLTFPEYTFRNRDPNTPEMLTGPTIKTDAGLYYL